MVKPKKERFLKELYNATQIILRPKITPVLQGSYRMQGPVDEVEDNKWTNTVFLQVDEGDRRPSKNQKLHLRADSGTCNVCAAPCSSCLHVKQGLMEKAEAFSVEPCSEKTVSYSANDDMTVKRTCENEQHTTSETSNLVSVTSSYNSLSENAESKVNMGTSDVFVTSEVVKVSPKLSFAGDFKVDDFTLKPKTHPSNINHTIKFDDPRGLEGHDDNLSCVTGAEEPNVLSSSVIRKTVPCRSASTDSFVIENCGKVVPLRSASESMDFKFDVEGMQNNSCRHSKNDGYSGQRACTTAISSGLFGHHLAFMENPSMGNPDNDTLLQNTESTFSGAPCGKFPTNASISKELAGESCSHLQPEFPGCSGDHFEKGICDVDKSSSYTSDELQNSKVSEQILEAKNVGNFLIKSDAKEASLQTHHDGESDESEFVEHDVKVCDICGDAGREDLLAVCCRCIDGAEHTYCMREMLDKVPEVDWLCEECKLEEESKKFNQQKHVMKAGSEKDQSAQADIQPATDFMKTDGKGSDVEGTRTSKDKDRSVVKFSGKRRAEESEVPSAVKRQAFESVSESPKASSPTRLRALSFDSFIKDIDSGKESKGNPGHQFSSSSQFGNDAPEAAGCRTGPQLQSSRGAFFKSNSFNFSNRRPKTKHMDEVVLQKQISMKESASRDTKEGAARGMSKSMSFRSNSGRFGASESKVKMLSPKFSNVQDLKGLKNRSEKNLERKNSIKLSRVLGDATTSSSTTSTLKVDKRLAESGAFSSAFNNEGKPLKSDRKVTGSKPTSRATDIGAEVPASTGDVKGQLPSFPNGIGTASSGGIIRSIEQRPVSSALKDDSSSDFTYKELVTPADVIKEVPTSHLSPSMIPGTSGISCLNSQQAGHSAENCKVDCKGSFDLGISASRSPKVRISNGNQLKDAIEAAMLKKPGMYRRNRISDQSDELSVSSMNNEVASQDREPNSSNVGNMTSPDAVGDWQGKGSRNSSADNGKQMNGNNFKQPMLPPAEVFSSRVKDGSMVVPSDGKHYIELPNHDAVAFSALLKIPAIPDHEYIWQGSFEVQGSEKRTQIWDGLQAHLSTCASPRVFEAVNKLPERILLNEVSRINAWPVQFGNIGVNEESIALYFFAKDFESYERCYKILLEDMMRGDLALVGSIDGVELLIFPSNHLPEKSHRWNMLFFLWGVFRGKKRNCLHQVPGSPEKFSNPKAVPSNSTDKMSLPEDISSPGSLDRRLLKCDGANVMVPEAPALKNLQRVSLLQTMTGHCDTKASSLFCEVNCSELNLKQQDCETHSTSSLGWSCPEMKCISTPLVDSECKENLNLRASLPERKADRMSTTPDSFNSIPAGSGEMYSFPDVHGENVKVPNGMSNSRDVVNCGKSPRVDQGSFVMEVATKELNGLKSEPRNHQYVDLSEDSFTGISEVNMWHDVNSPIVDKGILGKKHRNGLHGEDNYDISSSGGIFNLSSPKKQQCERTLNENAVIVPGDNNGERYFFPVDPTCEVKGESFPLIGTSSPHCEQDRLTEKGRTPNLELALGAELKQPLRQDISPCLVGNVDRSRLYKEDQPSDKLVTIEEEGEEEEDGPASLSLSLSFSYAEKDKDKAVEAVPRTGQPMSGNQQSSPSMLLFGDIPGK